MHQLSGWLAVGLALGCGAAPPVAVRAADPIARMGVAWRIRGRSQVVQGLPLLMIVGGNLQVTDPRDGHRFPGAWTDPAVTTIIGLDRLAIVAATSSSFVALALPRASEDRMTERWRFTAPTDTAIDAIAAGAGRVWVALSGEDTEAARVVAFGASTGSVAWRQAVPAGWRPVALDAAGLAICRPAGEAGESSTTTMLALGFDPETGRIRWKHEVAAAHDAASDGRWIAIARDGALVIVDVVSGASRELALPRMRDGAVAIAGGTAFVAAGAGPGGVAAVELAERRVRWLHAGPPMTGRPAITEHGVFVVTTGAVLHGLDRTTGEARWAWGLAHDASLVAGPDERLYATEPATGDTIAFAPRAGPPPDEAAIVRGRVASCTATPAVVRVGDVESTVAADGRFEVHVRGRGAVHLVAVAGDTESFETDVALVGHGRYNAGVLRFSKCR